MYIKIKENYCNNPEWGSIESMSGEILEDGIEITENNIDDLAKYESRKSKLYYDLIEKKIKLKIPEMIIIEIRNNGYEKIKILGKKLKDEIDNKSILEPVGGWDEGLEYNLIAKQKDFNEALAHFNYAKLEMLNNADDIETFNICLESLKPIFENYDIKI